jgi:integrase
VVERYIVARRSEKNGKGKSKDEPVRGQTIVREVQALRRGLKIARRRGALRKLPDDWPSVRRDPPRESQRGHLHAPEVLRKWLDALPEDARAQATVALQTGLRATELRRIAWGWVERVEGMAVPALLRVPAAGAKTRTERVVGLPAESLEVLERLAAAHEFDRDVPLMDSDYKKSFHAASTAIEYDRRIHLRDLRHCYSTLGLQGTGDATATQAALGHAQLATTQRYLSSTLERAAAVSAAVARAIAPKATASTEAGGDSITPPPALRATSPAQARGRNEAAQGEGGRGQMSLDLKLAQTLGTLRKAVADYRRRSCGPRGTRTHDPRLKRQFGEVNPSARTRNHGVPTKGHAATRSKVHRRGGAGGGTPVLPRIPLQRSGLNAPSRKNELAFGHDTRRSTERIRLLPGKAG